jgi:hypothetical protein
MSGNPSVSDIEGNQIKNILEENFNLCGEQLKKLFAEDAKFSLDSMRKEGAEQIFKFIDSKKSDMEKKGKLVISQLEGIEINESSKLFSGFCTFLGENYMITIYLEDAGNFNLLISNFMLSKTE